MIFASYIKLTPAEAVTLLNLTRTVDDLSQDEFVVVASLEKAVSQLLHPELPGLRVVS
jgi:hypothetical protein